MNTVFETNPGKKDSAEDEVEEPFIGNRKDDEDRRKC